VQFALPGGGGAAAGVDQARSRRASRSWCCSTLAIRPTCLAGRSLPPRAIPLPAIEVAPEEGARTRRGSCGSRPTTWCCCAAAGAAAGAGAEEVIVLGGLPDETAERALRLAVEHVGAGLRRFSLRQWNGESILDSPAAPLLERLGFRREALVYIWEGG